MHGNAHIVAVIRDLRRRSRLYGLEDLAGTGLMLRLCEEHQQMVDAALERDGETMRTLMAQHIGHVRSVWAGRDVEQ